jgi:hypothetical protein
LESCTGPAWWIDFALENTGDITFESWTVTLIYTDNGQFLPQFSSQDFINHDCNATDTQPNLPPGATHIVSLPVTADPSGRPLQATIGVCPNASFVDCVNQTINFTP